MLLFFSTANLESSH